MIFILYIKLYAMVVSGFVHLFCETQKRILCIDRQSQEEAVAKLYIIVTVIFILWAIDLVPVIS